MLGRDDAAAREPWVALVQALGAGRNQGVAVVFPALERLSGLCSARRVQEGKKGRLTHLSPQVFRPQAARERTWESIGGDVDRTPPRHEQNSLRGRVLWCRGKDQYGQFFRERAVPERERSSRQSASRHRLERQCLRAAELASC